MADPPDKLDWLITDSTNWDYKKIKIFKNHYKFLKRLKNY